MVVPRSRCRSICAALEQRISERSLALGVTAVPILLILALSIRAAPDWMPTTDWALIELRVRDVGRSLPLLGVPSAVGFHHPGPMMYLLLAPVYWLLGSDPSALLVSAAALNCVAIGGSAWVAWRRGGLWLTVWVVALMVTLAGSAAPGFLFDPWNPWLALLPFVWLILLVWSVVEDDLWLAPVAIAVGSFVTQTHVGYAVPVLALGLVIAAVSVWRLVARSRLSVEPAPEFGTLARIAAVSLGAGAVCWAGPIYEQVTREPGNGTTMYEVFVSPGPSSARPLMSASAAVGLLAREMALVGPWTGAKEPVDLFSSVIPRSPWHLIFPVGVFLVSAALLFGRWSASPEPSLSTPEDPLGIRRPDRSGIARLFLVNTAATAAIIASIARLEGGRAFPYIVRGIWAVVALSVLVVLAAGFLNVCNRFHERAKYTHYGMTILGAMLLVASMTGVIADQGSVQIPIYNPDVSAVLAQCTRTLLGGVLADARGRDVHMSTTEAVWPPLTAPLVNELDRRGLSVDIEPSLEFFFDRPGVAAAPNVVPYVLVKSEVIDEWNAKPGVRHVVTCDALSRADRAFMNSSRNRLQPTQADRLREFALSRRNVRAAVYRLPRTDD